MNKFNSRTLFNTTTNDFSKTTIVKVNKFNFISVPKTFPKQLLTMRINFFIFLKIIENYSTNNVFKTTVDKVSNSLKIFHFENCKTCVNSTTGNLFKATAVSNETKIFTSEVSIRFKSHKYILG